MLLEVSAHTELCVASNRSKEEFGRVMGRILDFTEGDILESRKIQLSQLSCQ